MKIPIIFTPIAHISDFSQIEDPEHTLIIKEEQEARMKAIQNQLSSFEKIVLDLYLNGFSYTEIADQVGRSLKSVDNAIQRIRRKVAAVLVSRNITLLQYDLGK